VPTFVDRGCHADSVTDPYGRILGFLDRSRYFLFQTRLSRPEPLLSLSSSSSVVLKRLSGPHSSSYFSENLAAPAIELGPLDL
jgi:hypothetical protein